MEFITILLLVIVATAIDTFNHKKNREYLQSLDDDLEEKWQK